MRKLGDLMLDLGFDTDAPVSTKRAFIEHLVRAADVTARNVPLSAKQIEGEAQLSLDPEILGILPHEMHKKLATKK